MLPVGCGINLTLWPWHSQAQYQSDYTTIQMISNQTDTWMVENLEFHKE